MDAVLYLNLKDRVFYKISYKWNFIFSNKRETEKNNLTPILFYFFFYKKQGDLGKI